MQMTMARLRLGTLALALGAAACGDSSTVADTSTPGCDPTTTECGPTFATDDATTICEAACARYAVCTDVEPTPANTATCVAECAPDLVKGSRKNTCKYTSANIDTCAAAYESFSCNALTVDGSAPEACAWKCDPNAPDGGS
jgi:hypothetical protein